MAYYDNIAKQWHEATGYKGGAFKALVMNDVLLKKLSGISNCSILELGAGNGYFLPLVLRRFSGQVPSAITITDQSERLLQIAKKHFRLPDAEYQTLDIAHHFPFNDRQFDLILATMVFNEVAARDFQKGLRECHRVLASKGLFLMTVIHPAFVSSLHKRGLLSRRREGVLTMPGSGSFRVPVVMRSCEVYRRSLKDAGFQFEEEEVFPTTEVLNVKFGLRNAREVPVALIFRCNSGISETRSSGFGLST